MGHVSFHFYNTEDSHTTSYSRHHTQLIVYGPFHYLFTLSHNLPAISMLFLTSASTSCQLPSTLTSPFSSDPKRNSFSSTPPHLTKPFISTLLYLPHHHLMIDIKLIGSRGTPLPKISRWHPTLPHAFTSAHLVFSHFTQTHSCFQTLSFNNLFFQ